MRYGNAHNVHQKNKKSDFTRQPKNMQEFLGNPLNKAQTGESRPILEEGYSYEGGEDMVAVGEVGVSKRYGGGRDGTHHNMERRMVYKKAPEPTEEKETTVDAEPEGPKGPKAPLPPVSRSKQLVTSNAIVDQYEENTLKGNSVYGAGSQQQDAQQFMDSYKQKISDKYEEDERGNYVDSEAKAQYDKDFAQYEIDKAEFDAQQPQQVSTSEFLQKKKDALKMKRDF